MMSAGGWQIFHCQSFFPIILSKHSYDMDGWTNSLLIPYGKLQFLKNHNHYFQFQNKHARWSQRLTMLWLTAPCALNTGERKLAGFCNAKSIAFLLIWPPTVCGTLLHWVDSQKHHTSTMTAAYNTHTHTRTSLWLGEISAQVEYDNTRELRKTQQKVTHPSNVLRKALFFSCALHPTRASSWN